LIRKLLYGLFGVLAFVLGSAGPGSTTAFAAHGDATFTLDARIALNGFRGIVEEHLAGVLNGLKGLAATQDARSGDWDRLKAPLQQLSDDAPTDISFWFARPDGSYFTLTTGLTDQNMKDREYYSVLMAGKDVPDSLVVGKVTGQRQIIIGTPLTRDGMIVGAIGAAISVEKLASMVDDRLRLPKDMVFYALDGRGLTALHRESRAMFRYPSEDGDQTLKSAVGTMLSVPEGSERYTAAGGQETVIFEKSRALGWVFVLGITNAR
jgi:hypothetical protein